MKPDLETLRAAVFEFGGYAQPDKSLEALTLATAPAIDLARAEHSAAMHVWLNAWGCRIRKRREGEPDVFGQGVGEWWARWHEVLPTVDTWMVDLTDDQLESLAECFVDLVAARVASNRSMGPTAASKMLFALRPNTVMPWDEMIAQRLHGGRGGVAYASHQRLGREWARDLLAEAGMDEPSLAELFGRPGRSLAKMIDEYCYLVFTRDGAVTVG